MTFECCHQEESQLLIFLVRANFPQGVVLGSQFDVVELILRSLI